MSTNNNSSNSSNSSRGFFIRELLSDVIGNRCLKKTPTSLNEEEQSTNIKNNENESISVLKDNKDAENFKQQNKFSLEEIKTKSELEVIIANQLKLKLLGGIDSKKENSITLPGKL